jgi:glucuronoarabinoxylan endo-1,4-beta-xylanase
MKKHPSCLIRVFAAVAAAGAISMNAHAQCNINMSSTQQTIDGFGFSSAWSGTLTTAKNNALYGTLGMSLLRVQIDPGGNWAAEATNAAAAHAAGAKVLGSSWSAPGSWTTTGNAYDGQLQTSHYGDYANWLASAVTAHKLDWVSPANEPDLGWMSWTTNELITWISQYGGSLGAPLLAPESCWFADPFTSTIINDPNAGPNISIAGGHGYGGPSTHPQDLSKKLWMTENYIEGTNDISACMSIAKEISDYMNDQFSAYIWWDVNDGSDIEPAESNGFINRNGYTMGQFAKWVRPNSTRVTATYNPQSNVSVTAYKVNNGTVIVAVNTGGSSVSQQFVIQNGNAATMEGYRTSSSQGMSDIGSFTVSGGSFTANLPAQSVTTFVQTSRVSTTTGAWYYMPNRTSGLVIDNGGSTNAGAQMGQWSKVNSSNLKWQLVSSDSGYYYIQNQTSGLYLDGFGYTTNGAAVKQWSYSGSYNQQWQPVAADSGYYYFKNRTTGLCLDGGGATANGAALKQWSSVTNANLQWSLQPVDGTYKLISQYSGSAMDVWGAVTTNGSPIAQCGYTGGANQQWTLTALTNNLYKIIGVQSGRALDVDNSQGGTANGTRVMLYDYNSSGSNQKYKLTSTEVGQFRITPNSATGSCLDVSGPSTADGATVHLWQWLNAANQKWSVQAP